jgi:hypothetical protein
MATKELSGDYDFIDIFKMSMKLNPNLKNVTFRMIVPVRGATNSLIYFYP